MSLVTQRSRTAGASPGATGPPVEPETRPMRLRELFGNLALLPIILRKIDRLMSQNQDLLDAEARVEAVMKTASSALTTQASQIKTISDELLAAKAGNTDVDLEAIATRLNAAADGLTSAIPTASDAPAAPAEPAPAPADASAADAPPAAV